MNCTLEYPKEVYFVIYLDPHSLHSHLFSLKPLQIYTGIPTHTPPIKIFITSVHYNPDQIYGDVPTHGPHRPYLPKFGEYSFLPPQVI